MISCKLVSYWVNPTVGGRSPFVWVIGQTAHTRHRGYWRKQPWRGTRLFFCCEANTGRPSTHRVAGCPRGARSDQGGPVSLHSLKWATSAPYELRCLWCSSADMSLVSSQIILNGLLKCDRHWLVCTSFADTKTISFLDVSTKYIHSCKTSYCSIESANESHFNAVWGWQQKYPHKFNSIKICKIEMISNNNYL